MAAGTVKRAPFKSGVRWYSLWSPDGKRAGYERHVVSAIADGSATIETLSVYRTAAGLNETTSTLAFGSGGARLEVVRVVKDGKMDFHIRRAGDVFNGRWVGHPFQKPLPPDFLPNFGNAEWIATLPQEPRGFWGFTRMPMGTDVPGSASIECVGEEEVRLGTQILRAWHYVERVAGKERNHWWVDKDRVVVKFNFGLEGRLEAGETAARTEVTIPFPQPKPVPPIESPTAIAEKPTKLVVEIPLNPVVVAKQEPPKPAPAPPPRPKPEHILPAAGRPPTAELGRAGLFQKTHRWYSLWNDGKPAGYECHMVNPTGEGAMLETEMHFQSADGTWHDSSSVVVFGAHDRIANCHFMQDGIQTDLGQPFFTLRRIETGFIGTWQGKPYKRSLPDDFVPGFGLHEWIATFSQVPGTKHPVSRLAMNGTEPVPVQIECHGEEEVEIRGTKSMLCKFVERLPDKVRAIWWVDRNRIVRKHYFGMEALLEESEGAAKKAGVPQA